MSSSNSHSSNQPGSSSSSSSSSSGSGSGSGKQSTVASVYRQFGGYYNFALSYGLHPGRDDEDIRAIAEEMVKYDNGDYEEEEMYVEGEK
jgi:hypothetical protein